MRTVRTAVAALLALGALAGPARAGSPVVFGYAHSGTGLPNPRATPGAVGGATEAQICAWAADGSAPRLHLSVAQQRAVFARYGLGFPQPQGLFKIEAYVPLELGGTTAPTNLWPQPRTGAVGWATRDAAVPVVVAALCDHRVDLQRARGIAEWPTDVQRELQPPSYGQISSIIGIGIYALPDAMREGTAQRITVMGSIGDAGERCWVRVSGPDGDHDLGVRSGAYTDVTAGPATPTWHLVAPRRAGVLTVRATCRTHDGYALTARRSVTVGR